MDETSIFQSFTLLIKLSSKYSSTNFSNSNLSETVVKMDISWPKSGVFSTCLYFSLLINSYIYLKAIFFNEGNLKISIKWYNVRQKLHTPSKYKIACYLLLLCISEIIEVIKLHKTIRITYLNDILYGISSH